MKPVRIQRKRVKGWKMPENTISVTRPGKWGNCFKIGGRYKWGGLSNKGIDTLIIVMEAHVPDDKFTTLETAEECIEWYEKYIYLRPGFIDKVKKELKGKNLACFCKEGHPCHAGILLKIANG